MEQLPKVGLSFEAAGVGWVVKDVGNEYPQRHPSKIIFMKDRALPKACPRRGEHVEGPVLNNFDFIDKNQI
jgi:hypothetical protein